jgi:ABC-type multidrug transport system fused ATPase/permease subunit
MVVGASLAVCEQWAQILEAVGASERVMELLNRPQAPQMEAGLSLPPSLVLGAICFDRVHFAYPARPEVQALHGLSVTLDAGKVTAFVGASGSGKSTVAKLVQRLYDPDAGDVTLDGRSLRSLDSSWFRSLLGVVSQEPKLFPADVAANIRYGKPAATQAAVEAAAKLANAHDFILTLPDGCEAGNREWPFGFKAVVQNEFKAYTERGSALTRNELNALIGLKSLFSTGN